MSNWVVKFGFPIINVEETGDGKIKITQAGPCGPGVKAEEDETLWYVPLEIKTFENGKASIDHTAILPERSMTVWVVPTLQNLTETLGAYRVGYLPQRFAKFGKVLALGTAQLPNPLRSCTTIGRVRTDYLR